MLLDILANPGISSQADVVRAEECAVPTSRTGCEFMYTRTLSLVTWRISHLILLYFHSVIKYASTVRRIQVLTKAIANTLWPVSQKNTTPREDLF